MGPVLLYLVNISKDDMAIISINHINRLSSAPLPREKILKLNVFFSLRERQNDIMKNKEYKKHLKFGLQGYFYIQFPHYLKL